MPMYSPLTPICISELINDGKYEFPTVDLVTTLLKPAGKANQYVRSGYGLKIICNNTQGQLRVSMTISADKINVKVL